MTTFQVRAVHLFACALFVSAFSAPRAEAQNVSSWGDLAVSAVAIDYDLSGTGQTAGLAVRLSRDLTDHLVLEGRGLFARPTQQSGPSTLFVPEAHLQYRWHLGRLTPFAGGGLGAAMVHSNFRADYSTDWDLTMSVAGGTGVRLTEQLGLIGELRVRGIDWDFPGNFPASTAEWSIGFAWRLPAF